MEEKKSTLGIHTLIYGLFTGLALIAFTLILYIANLYMNTTVGYFSFLILVAGMVIGALQYRKNQLNGFMTYGQAFVTAFLIGLFAALVSAVFTFFYMKYLNPGMINELTEASRQKMEAKAGAMSSEDIDRAMQYTEKFMTPVWMTIWGFVGSAFWSAILALVLAFFLKKKNPNVQPLA